MSKRRKRGKGNYKDVLKKLEGMNLGGAFWSPKPGRSVIRILPAVGEMEMFFKEVGIHRADNKGYTCPDRSTDGELPCPACEVNELLYQAGEKETAKAFYCQRKFYMNVIVRGEESAGPRIFTPGITVFGAVSSLVSDPDYGEIYDPDEGTDIVIDRTGTGLDTTYQIRPSKQYDTPLSDDESLIDKWLDDAKDLETFVVNGIKSYDELAKITGADVYLDYEDDDYDEDYEDDDIPFEGDDEYDSKELQELKASSEESASAVISKRLARRKQAKGRSSNRRRAR